MDRDGKRFEGGNPSVSCLVRGQGDGDGDEEVDSGDGTAICQQSDGKSDVNKERFPLDRHDGWERPSHTTGTYIGLTWQPTENPPKSRLDAGSVNESKKDSSSSLFIPMQEMHTAEQASC